MVVRVPSLRVDPDVDDLVHLHQRPDYSARNGANADPSIGSGGPQRCPHRPSLQPHDPEAQRVRTVMQACRSSSRSYGHLLAVDCVLMQGQGLHASAAAAPGPAHL